jgi:hypothetical protein
MKTLYACCERCKTVEEYHIYGEDTDFPRGHFLVCGNKYDALTTGFKTEREAQEYLNNKIAAQKAKEAGQNGLTTAAAQNAVEQ